MENSSKALIVAGSVILAVLIITLGMYFYNQSTTTGKGLNMTEYEIKQFNSKFKMYEGRINTAQALELIDAVERHNLLVGDDGIGVAICNRASWGPAGVTDDFFPSSTSYWYDDIGDLYDHCMINNQDDIMTGTEANNQAKIDESLLIEGRFYNCYLYYSKSNNLILGIYIRYIQ